MEGCNKFYSVPIQFVYRTAVDKSFMISDDAESIEDLIFSIIIGLIPRQADFHCGFNLGYIEPDNNLGLTSINNGPWIEQGYKAEQRFLTTLDLGFRFLFKIKRFGIVLAPNVNYNLTENFQYFSSDGIDNAYTAKWFLSLSAGLSFQF